MIIIISLLGFGDFNIQFFVMKKNISTLIHLIRTGRITKNYSLFDDYDISEKSMLREFDDWNVLFWSVSENFLSLVDYLIKKSNVQINMLDKMGYSLLALAVGQNNLEMVKLLILNGADPSTRIPAFENGTVLHLSCSYGFYDVTKYIFDNCNVSLNIQDDSGNTPFTLGIDSKNKKLVNWLKINAK